MKASAAQEEPRVAPHPVSWRAVQDEVARLKAERETDRSMLAAQDARLAKAGATIADLERIAAHRLDELVSLRARVLELEPLAEVGRRMEALRDGYAIVRDGDFWSLEDAGGFTGLNRASTLADLLRAAGIGEEVGHDS